MKTTLRSLFVFCLSMHLASAQWVLQPSVTTADLWKIKFVDPNHGWILGQYFTRSGIVVNLAYQSQILKTTNGGDSWSDQVLDNCVLIGMEFTDTSAGWLVGQTKGRNGIIYKTTDGGTSWNYVDSSAAQSFHVAVRFIDDLHGWIGGFNDTASYVWRTVNGGSSWQVSIDTALDVNDLFFVDSLNGWDVGENGKVYKSTDAGASWQAVFKARNPYSPSSPDGYSPLRRIQFTDSSHGFAVGGLSGGETKLWTSDGGASWNVVDKTQGSSLHGLWMTANDTGWTVGGANAGLTIQKTNDGGQSWTSQQFPSNLGAFIIYFQDVAFVSPNVGWIVGDSGVILKTTNGGNPITGIAENHYGPPSEFRLDQNYPNPFNPSTSITFSIPVESVVSLEIFDALGRMVKTVVAGKLAPGIYTREWDASAFPSGMYFCRLSAGSFVQTRKLLLLR